MCETRLAFVGAESDSLVSQMAALCRFNFELGFNTAITGSGRWRVASELLAAMPAQDTVSHNAAISQADRWECAVELLGSMSHRALQPSVTITFNTSIKACESTWTTWALQLLPGSPDAFGANGVLAASRSWRRALALGRSLAWRRLHLDQVGLSAAISCCEPVWPVSIDLLHGSGFAPNEVASSAAISGCEKGYQWARALGLVAWMRLLRLQPNTTGCNSAISACEKGFAWRWALQLLRGMVGAAVESTETTINSLCSACEKSSIWQAAIGLLPKLDALAPEHPMAFNAAMCACQKGGCSWKLIAQLLSALQRAHRFSVVSFDAALSAKGDWRWGCELLWQMQAALLAQIPASEAAALGAAYRSRRDRLGQQLTPGEEEALRTKLRGLYIPYNISAARRDFGTLRPTRDSKQTAAGRPKALDQDPGAASAPPSAPVADAANEAVVLYAPEHFNEHQYREQAVLSACPMAVSVLRWRYISDSGRQKLPEHRYSGTDNSLMYIYFCSPLADWLVQFFPLWLAPNVITLLGLAVSLLGYLVVQWHSPSFTEPCPSWVWFLAAWCTFTYQTLDNIDGKQARRTDSASPLGLFIDHGADGLNIVLSSLNVLALLQLGARASCWASVAVWAASSVPFFSATWEEYFTGTLYLGAFNGPTDGVLILCAAYLATGLLGQELWSAEVFFGFCVADATIAFYGVCVLVTALGNLRSVWEVQRARKHSMRSALGFTRPFCGQLLAACSLGPRHPQEVDLRIWFWFLGAFFLILVSLLQLAHVCSESYVPWRWSVLALAVLVADKLVSPFAEMKLAMALVLTAWLHLVLHAIWEMAEILRIPILTLSRKTSGSGAPMFRAWLLAAILVQDGRASAQWANATRGALQAYLHSRFGASPSVMPAKGDPALDPCPVLNDWPNKLEIDVPSPCNLLATSGSWTSSEISSSGAATPLVMSWMQQCSALGGGLVPVTTYSLPSGGLFGTSQMMPSLTGNTLRLEDCVGYTRYYLDEKVYYVPGEPDAHACEMYHSCDGSVLLQFIIRDHAGRKMAHTPYLRLFQSSFNIEDANGLLVAQVERIGHWNPMSKVCSGQAHKWLVKFPDLGVAGASSIFPTAADRWPVAQLVTVMATRDGSRGASGLVHPGLCEAEKTGLLVASLVFVVVAVSAVVLLFVRVGIAPMQVSCLDFEARFCTPTASRADLEMLCRSAGPRRKKAASNLPKYTF
ncbi:unnamed protein product [Effrenium voratum]|nr:unnamed protein product [Effrenium voratum]